YIMTDLIEVPNLQAKSRALITHQVKNLLFGRLTSDPVLARMPLPRKRFWLFYTYAILSWLYGYWVIYQLIIFMKPHLAPLGLEGLADWFSILALTSWVLLPFIGFFKGLQLTSKDWAPHGRLRRLSLIGAVAIGVFGATCFFPVELTIKRVGAVQLAEPDQVRPEVPGFLEQIFVKEGDHVKAGQPLAQLSNREARQALAVAETRLQVAEQMVQAALGLGKLAEQKQAENTRAAQLAKTEEARREVDQLTLRAHIDGTVLTRSLDTKLGMYLQGNDLFCEIAALDPMRIKIALSEKQVRYVKKGQRVRLKANAYPHHEFQGVVAEDPVMFFGNEIPAAFSARRSGDVPVYIDAHGKEHPVERTFEAVVAVENGKGLLRPGMTGRGKIYAGRRPWGQMVLQSVRDVVSLDYRF
ncbi:MAG TPA: efflux RND transporter periplasmic adaptor subunit, partial [Chthoniobacteraceae bacterium]|nr:efflux RND transporter periplasmic adaptor subunit [Chthoniobacteraceae bacterium]